MNILIFSAEFPPLIGGVGTFTYNLAKSLDKVGISVCVVTSVDVKGSECVQDVCVVRTLPLLNKKFLKILPLLWSGIRYCIKKQPTKIIAMSWSHEGIVAFFLKKMFGIDYLLVAHGSEILQNQKNRIIHSFMLKIFIASETIIANSQYTKQLIEELKISPFRIAVINPPVSISENSTCFDTSTIDEKFALKGKRVLLTTARLVKRKGHAQVITALSEICNRYSDIVYVMTGEGTLRDELELLAHDLKITEQIRMIGYVSQAELWQLYHRSEIYVSPSQIDEGDVEGFGISLIEASSCGKPVIAGNSGGVTDAVINGITGFLIDPLNTEELKNVLVELLDNSALRNKIGLAGKIWVTSAFSLQSQGERMKQLLQVEAPIA